MVATLTDKIGTEAEEMKHKMAVASLYDRVPKVFENEVIVRLPYSFYTGSDTFIPGVNAEVQVKCNSIYDPDAGNSIGNGQSLGRDTWANIYNYYKVLKTVIKVQCADRTLFGATTADTLAPGANAEPSIWGGMLDLTGTFPALQNWLNAAHAGSSNRQQVFTEPQIYEVVVGKPQKPIEFTMTWNPTLFETAILDQSTKDTWTPVGSDPDNLEYFSLLSFNPSATNRSFWFKIDIEFLVAFKQVNKTLLNTLN